MAHITNVNARYLRRMQPAQYEAAEAELSVNLALDEGEEPNGEVLLAALVVHCHKVLGLKVSAHVVAHFVERPVGPEVAAAAQAAEAKKRASQKTPEPEAPKAADPFPTAAPTAPAPAEPSGTPAEPAAPAPTITNAELQTAAGQAAQRVGRDKVKALIGEYGVKTLNDLPQELRAEFVAWLKELK